MKTLNNLFVLGRPAGGKSEFIHFLKNISDEERAERFHIGRFEEADDFPWVWETFVEDDRRERRGERRLWSELTPDGHILTMPKFRAGLVENFNRVITEKCLTNPSFYKQGTLLIEFSRGKTDGFMESLEKFRREILEDAAILYIKVSFEESLKRNNARFKKDQDGSILFHKVAERDMLEYFIENDWDKITKGRSHGHIVISNVSVPFVTVFNEPESTDPDVIGPRYKQGLDKLWEMVSAN